MTQPLALVLYEKLLPGTQLVNRLQDLKYRVKAVTDAGALVECARQEKPMIVLADLTSTRDDVCAIVAKLKSDAQTSHLPVIAMAPEADAQLQAAARKAGATLVVNDSAILGHLPQLLEQALQID
jgi:CheY-like chemotaxis protein